jgi:hypothetical protein
MDNNEIAVLPKVHDTPTKSNSDSAMASAKHLGFSAVISNDSQNDNFRNTCPTEI